MSPLPLPPSASVPLALRLPLSGSRLIEASAGTGKTWTIAALYVRLVLGHGVQPSTNGDLLEGACARTPLLPSQILVMTFTRAATQELSARIRERLSEAARFFRGNLVEEDADALLPTLRDEYPVGPARELAAWRLAHAADTMDDAAIYTIDAWCNKVLQSYASLTNALNGDALGGDTQTLWQWAALDFWRNHVYPLQGPALEAVLQLWPDAPHWIKQSGALQNTAVPEAALPAIFKAGAHAGDLTNPAAPRLQQWLEPALQQQAHTLAALAQGWHDKSVRMEQWLDDETNKDGLTGKHWHGTKLKPASFKKWFQCIRQWAAKPGSVLDGLDEKNIWRLSFEGLLDARTSKAPPFDEEQLPEEFAEFQHLMQALAAIPAVGQGILALAVQYTQQRWQQLKAEQGAMDFADLLVRVQYALSSPQGGVLRQRLLQEYPVAMIDEFQDTSPGQYQVFHDLYHPQDNDPAQVLLLIGDPKQSIYGFRGADIYSYLAAKRETAGRHDALDTNFRSTHAVVDAVNHVFSQAEEREGFGAFFFRSQPLPAQNEVGETPTVENASKDNGAANPLPFLPVRANGLGESLCDRHGQPVPALTVCTQQEAQASDAGNDWFAQCCAEQIVQWLQDDGVHFQPAPKAQRPARPLQPGDIAILVHRRRDAVRMQHALRQRGLRSVYLSDRESVYASAQAPDLVSWLQAVAQPADVGLAKTALATPLLGLTLEQLQAHVDDEAVLEERLELLQQLHTVWRKQGVLPMLRQTIYRLGLASQWLAAEDGLGERKLTNVLHLAELLQQASRVHEGEQGLIRFLVQQIHLAHADGAMDAEEQTVRLESDARLIQIVTVHKSKGLEYPVVMLPFASYMRPMKSDDTPLFEEADREDDTASAPDVDDERLREDLRLLYVALTRARHALWVGFPVNRRMNSKSGSTLHRSALGYLLCGQATTPVDDEAWWPLLQAWQAQCPHIAAQLAPPLSEESQTSPVRKYQPEQVAEQWLPERLYPTGIDQQFAIASFSMLARGAAHKASVQMHAASLDEDDTDSHNQTAFLWLPTPRKADDEADAQTTPGLHFLAGESGGELRHSSGAHWHALAGSSRLGDWMHDALEALQAEGFVTPLPAATLQRLQRKAVQAGMEAQWPSLAQWLEAIVQAPLPLQQSMRDAAQLEDRKALTGDLPPVPATARLGEFTQTLAELEFWLPVEQAHATQLDALCRQYCWPGQPRPALSPRQWHGMLMGFADLVVEWQGRFWVLDYKTNRLGDSAASYVTPALRDAVLHHRYDLQAMLYLHALHRLLQARLPGYDPQQHLGGAMYWFLRGIDHDAVGVIHFETPCALLTDMDRVLGNGRVDAAEAEASAYQNDSFADGAGTATLTSQKGRV